MSAAAAHTKNLRLQSNVVLPFYDPLRLAEEFAVVDIISNGRTETIDIGGYAVPKFEMFDVRLQDCGKRIEEAVSTLRLAWTGETFSYRGRKVRVRPQPIQQPGIPIFLGGGRATGIGLRKP